MIMDYHRLMGTAPIVMEQRYAAKESCIYALGVGCGLDPSDDWTRRHLGPLPPVRALPAMAIVLAAPRPHAMGLGATLSGMLHGSQGMLLHAPLPVEGAVRSETRVSGVFDRGEGRGCVIAMTRELYDAQTQTHYASMQMTFVCRSDQVAGAPPYAKAEPASVKERAPDLVVNVPTSPQAAQIFALTGDQNPLHLIPEAAVQAGFPQPILHGVATYGLCAAFAEKTLCSEGGRLAGISGRFSAPVFPGDTIQLAFWRETDGAHIEARVPKRDTCVFADGRVVIRAGA